MQTALVLPDTISTQVAVGAFLLGWKHLRTPLFGFVSPPPCPAANLVYKSSPNPREHDFSAGTWPTVHV